jgi:hypothetical protein
VVKSVQHTDWKSELTAFTQEVEAEAHKAVEVVQHLPQHIQLPHEQQQQQQGTRLSRISEVRRVSSSNSFLLLAVAQRLQETSSRIHRSVRALDVFWCLATRLICVADLGSAQGKAPQL